MIKVIVKNKDGIENVLVKGHANYEDYGKDIVCAAVSSITITACNSILALMNGKQYKFDRLKQSEKLNPEQKQTRLMKELMDKLLLLEASYIVKEELRFMQVQMLEWEKIILYLLRFQALLSLKD